jgi:hypothetical protein
MHKGEKRGKLRLILVVVDIGSKLRLEIAGDADSTVLVSDSYSSP